MNATTVRAAVGTILAVTLASGCSDDADPGEGGGGSGTTSAVGSTTSTASTGGPTTTASTGGGAGGAGGQGGAGGGPICTPGETRCEGTSTVEVCSEDGSAWTATEECSSAAGQVCSEGECRSACEAAAAAPSHVGCEFWAADLDQQDFGNDPASAPWGLTIANAGDLAAEVTIHLNDAPVGSPAELAVVASITVDAGTSQQVVLPTRELDCGIQPNDYASPGTCLSSRAFRVTSSAPVSVTQLNALENASSNDASLILPTAALGTTYRVLGWHAGHPIEQPGFPDLIDRSYITIIGTAANTSVRVEPSWRIKGNPPIAATAAGGEIEVTLGPFDVLNLETDDGTNGDDPETIADLSGSAVYADKPVAVFSGVETTQVPAWLEIPTYPAWEGNGGNTCCLDHLEEQLFPVETLGTEYVVTRSPVRSTSSFREPDVVRFVGAAEVASVTTTLPPPFDTFTLQPGEVRTTWTQDNFTASADRPFVLGQFLVAGGYVEGVDLGDPSMTVWPSVAQHLADHVVVVPLTWDQSWVVLAAEVGSTITLGGAELTGCTVEAAGTVDGTAFESRACAVAPGTHVLSGDAPFGVVVYGYATSASFAFVGGASFEKTYEPPSP